MQDDRTTHPLPADAVPAPEPVRADAIERGTHLGRYVLLDKLGAGGMSVVYAAWDPDLDRKVAIKLLHPKYCDAEGRLRVLREGQALARLSHPHVLAVYDVGSIGQQLFIATEYVDGVTLGAWLAERPRGWREVLDVLLEAGRGLAAAHHAKLVHRDVKPSNILVDRAGRAKVTDFGIARPVESGDTGAPTVEARAAHGPDTPRSAFDSPLTQEGMVVGTRAFMAPEHAAGRPDARSDQYSFCLVAREALFGSRGSAPPPPAWVRAAIVRGCAPRAEDRFETMDALLAQLCDDPALRRRRVLLGAAAVGVVALALAAAAWRAPPAPCRDLGAPWAGVWNDELAQAARRSMQATARPHAEETFARVDALLKDRGAQWAAMRQEACEATRLRGDQSERLLDLRMQCLERLRAETGALTALYRGALDGEAMDRAVEAARALSPVSGCADLAQLEASYPLPADPAQRAQAAELRRRLADATALVRVGKYAAGRDAAERVEEDAAALGWPPTHAEALYLRGTLESYAGRSAEAERALAAALSRAADARDDRLMAEAGLELLYVVGYDRARPDEALQLGNAVSAMVVRAGDAALTRARLLDRLGVIRWAKGDVAEAEQLFRRELELLERVAPGTPQLAAAHTNLGNALADQGRYAEARREYEQELALVERALGRDHPDVSRALSNLGTVLSSLGDRAGAQAAFERALALAEATWGPNHLMVAQPANNLGELFLQAGQPAKALGFCERALRAGEASLPPDHPAHAFHRQCVGNALLALHRPREAVTQLELAVALREAAKGDPAELAAARFALAKALWDAGADRQRALVLARAATNPLAAAGPVRREVAAELTSWLAERR